MNSYWLHFWSHLRSRTKYALWGLPLSLIPFFFNLPYLWSNGLIFVGLINFLLVGLFMGAVVWSLFMLAYLALGGLQLRYGYFPRKIWWFDLWVGLCGTVLGIILLQFVRKLIWNTPVDGGGIIVSLVIGLICLTVFIFFSLYQKAQAEALQHKAALSLARYHVLENQMHPHFLFNALNSLAELIESGSQNAADTALTLSDLYRKILTNSKNKTTTLQSELEITCAYLELEKLRFGSRLQFTVVAPDNTAQIYLPSLALQTLVENAVKHGIAKAVAGGVIEINVQRSTSQLFQLQVINTGAPYNLPAKALGTGLANTKERLQLLYGDAHDFKINTDDSQHTCVSFKFSGAKVD